MSDAGAATFEREPKMWFCAQPGCDNEVEGPRQKCAEHKRKPTTPRKRSNAKQLTLDALEEKLFENIAGLGLIVLPFNQFDGICVLVGAEAQSKTLRDLAEVSAPAKRALEVAVQASAFANVLTALAPTVIPILMNHKVIPGNPNAALMMAYQMAQGQEKNGGEVREMIGGIMRNMERKYGAAQSAEEARTATAHEASTQEDIADVPAPDVDPLENVA